MFLYLRIGIPFFLLIVKKFGDILIISAIWSIGDSLMLNIENWISDFIDLLFVAIVWIKCELDIVEYAAQEKFSYLTMDVIVWSNDNKFTWNFLGEKLLFNPFFKSIL